MYLSSGRKSLESEIGMFVAHKNSGWARNDIFMKGFSPKGVFQ